MDALVDVIHQQQQAELAEGIALGEDSLDQRQSPTDLERQFNGLGDGNDQNKATKRRISKACETCRGRRIKCAGGIPCDGCKALGEVDTCHVRVKARPNRAISSKREASQSVGPSSHQGGSKRSRRSSRPIRDIELAVAVWCNRKLGEDLHLELEDVPRLSRFQAASLLPTPLLDEYEDSLIEFLTTSTSTVTHLDFVDTNKLIDIYKRYRALPNSLTDDNKALLHACFCLASFTLARTKRGKDGHLDIQPNSEEDPREDVTYFRMACDDLTRWGRPSTAALWALHGLASYAAACGGVSESRDLLKTMSWHIKELGLDKQETASLYAPQEQVDKLFFSCFYQDSLNAAICDEMPFLRWGTFDIDPRAATTIPDVLVRVTIFESQLFDRLYDDSVDTSSPEFVLSWETKWLPFMKELRTAVGDGAPRVLLSWANMRFHWLWILLRAPCIDHPTLGASSLTILARCVAQILWTYSTLAASNQLNPAFSQIRRIVTCGHLLLLCYEAGEYHRAEADSLFRILLELLDKHRQTWPAANGLITGFTKAASTFDIDLETRVPLSPLQATNQPDPLGPHALEYTMPVWNEYSGQAGTDQRWNGYIPETR